MFTRMHDIDRMFESMDLFRNRMNRVFSGVDRSWRGEYGWPTESWPRTNVYEHGDSIVLVAEIPGVARDELQVKIQGNYLEISGSRPSDVPEGYAVHRIERSAADFSRSFTLPAEVDVDKVTAALRDGLLTLTLPKAEAAKPRQITIS